MISFCKAKRFVLTGLAALVILLVMAVSLDRSFPLQLDGKGYAALVVDAKGRPLRYFADSQGVYRYPTTPDQVSSAYIEALLGYEDRYFYAHFGVNPVSLLRAGWQWLSSGHIVSGGSTLTMQVARILDPHSRSIGGKLQQIFRALQLEWYLTKDEILTLYLNFAPFGGPLEGLEAASRSYFNKSANQLTDAEAALLAVLPQSPSRIRPDRYPQRAKDYRDKLLSRLADFNIWSEQRVAIARKDSITAQQFNNPFLAPTLARRLHLGSPDTQLFHTTLDAGLQTSVARLLKNRVGDFPSPVSVAALIVRNKDMATLAYAGSSDFFDATRFGQVDMVKAIRSPGSTLKPFIYAMAMEQGLIHSKSLLLDIPTNYDGYQPANFDQGFHGAIAADLALQKSLNVPAVQLLYHLGPAFFMEHLKSSGMEIKTRSSSLAVALGGLGTSLEDLVASFAALSRNGERAQVRYLVGADALSINRECEHRARYIRRTCIHAPNISSLRWGSAPTGTKTFLSPQSAWITRDILSQIPRPFRPNMDGQRKIAWKTGTSYGYRDSWAIGTSEKYTIGVWIGRADGGTVAGTYGAKSAGPILFDLFSLLPKTRRTRYSPPNQVVKRNICWPSGLAERLQSADVCQRRLTAWTIDGTTPKTLTTNVKQALGDPRQWPESLALWRGDKQQINLKIISLKPNTLLARQRVKSIRLNANYQGRLYWYLNGTLLHTNKMDISGLRGKNRLSVTDDLGRVDSLEFRVK